MLGRARTCDLLIRSPLPRGIRADTEGQAQTKRRLYGNLGPPEGHREIHRDTQLRSDCGQNGSRTKRSQTRWGEGNEASRGCDGAVVNSCALTLKFERVEESGLRDCR